jgi:hypothetical protein
MKLLLKLYSFFPCGMSLVAGRDYTVRLGRPAARMKNARLPVGMQALDVERISIN